MVTGWELSDFFLSGLRKLMEVILTHLNRKM
jgi:hypothetical protein